MTSKVGSKGQVVIPKRVRDELGIRPGDNVVVEVVDGAARVCTVPAPESLRGMFAGGPDLLAELEAEHRAEIERDERRARRS